VFGRDTLGRDQDRLDIAKDFCPGFIQLRESRPEIGRGIAKTIAQDLVRSGR
jgi:hypothetical protein